MTTSSWVRRHTRRRVNDLCPAPQLESGPDAREFAGSRRVAVLVHWSSDGAVSRSVSESVRQLAGCGYQVAVCSTCEAPGPLRWTYGKPHNVAVYRRPNVGIDFGTWGAMLTTFASLRAAEHVILVNDSMLGPFSSLAPIIERFEASACDVWGLVDSNQWAPHFQSHFVGYNAGALTDPPLAHFWSNIRLQPSKEAMIRRYERGLLPLLQLAGYRLGAGFHWQDVVANGENPTIMGWRRLLAYGFPYVKRELLWRPSPWVPDVAEVPAVVRARFGQEVQAWQ